MLFNSFGFLLAFLPLTLAGFAVASRLGPEAAVGWLTACSLAFYGYANPSFLLVLVASLIVNAGFGRSVRATEANPQAQRLILVTGIAVNLAAMATCRSLPSGPLGISFITFTQIGFLLDQRGADPRANSALGYCLLVVFFPHLPAGPILRVRDVMAQFVARTTWRLSGDNFGAGSALFLIGLLKKTLLAEPLAGIVAPGFDDPSAQSLLSAWQAALAWSFQLYFDFSGYSDMAIGLARLFGVRFPFNFASPYKSQSVIEYWQRWHMTLTQFLMSTVYNPLAMAVLRWRRAHGWPTDRPAQRSSGGFCAMLVAPIAVTMGLAGVWHGTNPTFLLFGLLHAGFLGVNHAWRLWRPGVRSGAWHAVLGRVALTYLCVLAGAVAFRAPTLGAAGALLSGMIGLHGLPTTLVPTDAHDVMDGLRLAGLAAIVWGMPNSQQIVEQHDTWLRWRPTLPWAAAAGFAACLGLLSLGGTGEFVYFQF
jgi:alginate O-acetyltransferase complex protein AlgI